MKRYIKELVMEALGKILSGETEAISNTEIQVMDPKPEFGDYATNAALLLFPKLDVKFDGGPAGLAKTLAEKIKTLDHKQTFAGVSNAGGFINFKLSKNYLANHVYQLAQKIVIAPDEQGPKKVVFEYSSPNTNKPLHIGHIRNDVYGMACVNMLKALGHNVVTCEIINDRGIHLMKSILMYQKHGEGKTPESENVKPDHFVGKFYTMFADDIHVAYAKGAEAGEAREKQLLEEAQDLLRRWEAGDEAVRSVWQQMNGWWYEGVKQTYEREGSYFDEVDYESQIYDKGRDIVLNGVDKGVFQKEEDGSVSVDLTSDGLDKKYLLRKDGTTIYITQDMHLWDVRNQRHAPDLAIVTTAIEQAYHFAVLGKIFELLKFPWARTFKHLPYEHVYLGKNKMSSRNGSNISSDELLDSVKARIREVMQGSERTKASADDDQLVEAVAYGAIKYGYLKYEPNTRIYFDLDQTISVEGNTGPYLQYAHARIRSILKKAGDFKLTEPVDLAEPSELALMRHLQYYQEKIVQDAAMEYKPNLLCNYLYELASLFNTFYNAVPVLATESEGLKDQRLTLLVAVASVLRHGLNLLGIEAPEEM